MGGPYRDGIPAANSVLYDTAEETVTLFRLPFPTGRLYRELSSHFFAPTLPTLQEYLAFLAGHLPPDITARRSSPATGET